jgi:hypothetical protein
MTVSSCFESIKGLPLITANAHMEGYCGISDFFENTDYTTIADSNDQHNRDDKYEYGDWQTSMELALSVCRLIKSQGISPKVIIEPTCGKGNFILAALQTFDDIEEIHGIEIYKPYLQHLKIAILQYFIDNPSAQKVKINLYHHNIFDFDFSSITQSIGKRETLILGNPPWVTNSKLGEIQSTNLPTKSNFKRFKGLDAITGKGNFDIAEFICERLINYFSGSHVHIALLIKNSVIKNIVCEQKHNRFPISQINQYNIDAKREFGASVAASLLQLSLGNSIAQKCVVRDFYTNRSLKEFGWINNCFVADIEAYKQFQYLDGVSPLVWWSGMKHDCSNVMELTLQDDKLLNGFNQTVDIEDEMIYPLVKSSDIKNDIITSVRKFVIVTQKTTSDDTKRLKTTCPKAYKYLIEHSEFLDKRSSSIYKNRPRFCLFGIGCYSFKKYKVVVSGLYKKPYFSLLGEINGKPVMVDDTCYLLGFDNYKYALLTQRILNSPSVQSFIHSLLFIEAKRAINKDLLMRINLLEAIKHFNRDEIDAIETEWNNYISFLSLNAIPKQSSLFE